MSLLHCTIAVALIAETSVAEAPFEFARLMRRVDDSRQYALQMKIRPRVKQISVSVAPTSVTLVSGAAQQFTATVGGTSNTAVTWSSTGGSVSASGLFSAPVVSVNTTIQLTATSVADSTVTASASVAVTPKAPAMAITTTSIPAATEGVAYATTLSASGGTQPYQWNLSSGSLPAGIQLDAAGNLSGSASQSGQFPLAVRVVDATSNSATRNFTLTVSQQSGGTLDGPAELPRVYIHSTMADTPAPGAVINVPAGGNIQNALNAANCGETIQLQAGATYVGRFTFPAKACDDQNWIIVRTSAPNASLPAEGSRMTPCYAGVASLTGRPAFNCQSTQKVVATIVYPGTGNGPVVFSNGANHYRLLGLEITRPVNQTPVGGLISLEGSGTANKLIFDRLWVHGTALQETRRGVQLGGSTNTAVIDSYFSDFHCIAGGACTDSQAISGGTGSNPMGPYKIVGNFLEAAAEGILFGGGPATQTPADIEVRRNNFFKPMIWMKGAPGFIGVTFIVKNHFELKNAQRVLLDSNVMQNTWGGFSQAGFSVVITPKNQTLNGVNVCPVCQVTDVTIRYLTISNVGSVFQIANALSSSGGAPLDGQRYSIHDVIADSIRGAALGGAGIFAQVSSVPSPILQNVMINHVTVFEPRMLFNVGAAKTAPMRNFTFTNSIVMAGTNPIWSTGVYGTQDCAYYDVPLTTVNACFSSHAFSNNAIIGSGTQYPPSKWPAGNFFPSSLTYVGFSTLSASTIDSSVGAYSLASYSPYTNAASDGTALGANVNLVLSSINGVK
jgi:hypothetical protein